MRGTRWAAALLVLLWAAPGLAAPALAAPKSSDRVSSGDSRRDSPGKAKKDTTSSDPSEEQEDGSAGTKDEPSADQPSPTTESSKPQPSGPSQGSGGAGRPNQGAPTASPSPSAQSAFEATVEVSPGTIILGETARVTVVVTNTGDELARNATATLTLPSELRLLDLGPPPFTVEPGGRTVHYDLGAIAPGAAMEVWADVEGVRATAASGSTISVIANADGTSTTAAASIIVSSEGNTSLDVKARTRETIVQIGDSVHYTIIVTNTGNEALKDVVIIDRLPLEVAFSSLGGIGRVDAVQVGRAGNREDIVWVKNRLQPGASLRLTWTGRARILGDLAALNRVRAKAKATLPVDEDQVTYLGSAQSTATTNPPFKTQVKARRVTRTVTGATATPGAVAGATLPFTGARGDRFIIVAVGLIAAGLLVWWAARSRDRRRRVTSIAAAVALLLMSACVASEPEIQRAQPNKTQKQEGQGKGKGKSQVKGRRINKGDDNRNDPPGRDQDGTEEPVDATTDAPAPIAPSAPPVVAQPEPSTTVTRTHLTRVTLADLPIDTLGDRAGDNEMNYTWDENARSITQATSSILRSPGATVELTTELSTSGDAITIDVVLRNLSSDRRLAVNGRLVHEVVGPVRTSFESAPIDTVLSPGGETSVRFVYLLPSGDYSAGARFDAV